MAWQGASTESCLSTDCQKGELEKAVTSMGHASVDSPASLDVPAEEMTAEATPAWSVEKKTNPSKSRIGSATQDHRVPQNVYIGELLETSLREETLIPWCDELAPGAWP